MDQCLLDLEEAIVERLPAFIERKRCPNRELFMVRPHFYDTCAPTCYLCCYFIYTDTAVATIERKDGRGIHQLWAYGEECGDHSEVFPSDAEADLEPLMSSCYQYLCRESHNGYTNYARSICLAARRLNERFSELSERIHSCFSITPADAASEAMNDADAIQLSIPESVRSRLGKEGFLLETDPFFGIYDPEIYKPLWDRLKSRDKETL
jgi:hypothetical protein